MLNTKIKSNLMLIASAMVQHGYTPENRGLYDNMKDVRTTYIPDNFIATYKELLEKFIDVDSKVK